MSLTFSIDENKMTKAFSKWQKAFGDSNKQAVARLAVSIAREQAVLVEPKGKAKKKIVDAIVNDGKKNIARIKYAKDFNRLANSRNPRFKLGGRWQSLDADQILRTPDEINRFIETHRAKKDGKVKGVHNSKKAVCRMSDFGKVMVQRKKRAGRAKGSILGAGMEAAKYQRGGRRISIGKNWMGWAQKHANLGRAKRKNFSGKPHINLISLAQNTLSTRILPKGTVQVAAERAWKKTTKWYLYSLKQIDK